ncbi:MAG: hypothetical protein B6247_24145 [Candidatus Parabeggiatoa sp. nov. 2]|nr:MAG: hypothetical protein B6247_24145 [Beggiatoa sp. 4572_84]
MYNMLNFIDYINTRLINIQPLRGWRVGGTFSTGCTCGYENPYRGWGVFFWGSTGCTCGYSLSAKRW